MTYDDIRKDLATWINFLRHLFQDVRTRSEDYARHYGNVLNGLFRIRRTIQSLEKILDTQDSKAIRRRCDETKVSIRDLENIVSTSQGQPDVWMQVVTCFVRVFDDCDILSELLAEASQSQPVDKEKGGQSEEHKKITKLTDFIINNCEDTTSISSKANRIHELVKKDKIKFMPKPVNKPKGNQTKLYDEEKLRQIWPKLKEKIVSLPNLKD